MADAEPAADRVHRLNAGVDRLQGAAQIGQGVFGEEEGVRCSPHREFSERLNKPAAGPQTDDPGVTEQAG